MRRVLFSTLLILYGLLLRAQVSTYPYAENWESGTGGWVASKVSASLSGQVTSSPPSDWGLGNTSSQGMAPHSGANAWKTNLGGIVTNNQIYRLTSPQFTGLSGLSRPTLAFWMAYDIEAGWDAAYVEYSLNGGAWTKLGTRSNPAWYCCDITSHAEINQFNVWTGYRWSWQRYSFDISALKGASTLQFRIVYKTDWAVGTAGAVVDDFSIEGDGDGILSGDNCPDSYNPDQADLDGDGAGDACDEDTDGDGTANTQDCAPRNAAVHPGATEVCNGVDDDCDGTIDEGFLNTVVTCPHSGTYTINLTQGCTYTVSGTELDATVVENCGPLGYTLSGATSGSGASLAGVVLSAGTTTITWSASKANGQKATCSFQVRVVPPVPVLSCPVNISVPATEGQCGAMVTFAAPVPPPVCATSGGAPTVTQIAGLPSGSYFPVGVTTNTFQVTDAFGQTATCSFEVVVRDEEAPRITCPSDIVVDASAGCDAAVSFEAPATDNCSVSVAYYLHYGSPEQTPIASPYTFTLGAHTVTAVAEDPSGNTTTCSFVVRVQDVTPPVITCPDNVEQSNDPGQCHATVSLAAATATDNCSYQVTGARSDGAALTAVYPVGVTTITWTVRDAGGNRASCTQTVTVNDTEKPVVRTQAISRRLDATGSVTITPADLDNGSTDNCAIASLSLDKTYFDCTEVGGPHTVTLTVVDVHGNRHSATADVTILPYEAATTLTVAPVNADGVGEQQYSDEVTFTATVAPGVLVNGSCTAAGSVTFLIGTRVMGNAPLVLDAQNVLTATLTVPLSEYANSLSVVPAEAARTVSAVFESASPAFAFPTTTAPLIVTHEDVEVEYVGSQFVTTPNVAIGTPVSTTVPLRVNLQDAKDGHPGDIRRAQVRFLNGMAPITLGGTTDAQGWIPVSQLINPEDTTLGTVSVEWPVTLGQNAYSESFTLFIEVGGPNGYYRHSDLGDGTVVTVSRPAMDFITGGGTLLPGTPAGKYPASTGRKINFGFNLKYNKSRKNLQGAVNIIYRRTVGDGVQVFQIKGNAMSSMGVDNATGKANLVCKANLKNLTTGEDLGGGHSLELKMSDNGEPGTGDLLAISLYKTDGTLLFSSDWTGKATREKGILSGNIRVSGGYTATATVAAQESARSEEAARGLTVTVMPNPSQTHFTLQLASSRSEGLSLRLLDMGGKVLEVRRGIAVNSTLTLGGDLRPGRYVLEVVQGSERRVVHLVKLP